MTHIQIDDKAGDSFLVIGDIHFKTQNTEECIEFSKKLLEFIDSHQKDLDFIVILGDTMDTHDVLKLQTYNHACKLIKDISLKKILLFVLIGNHDMINQTQFCTTNHAFFSLKGFNRYLHIIDKPTRVDFKERKYVMCPYVYPGRFFEALEMLSKKQVSWKDVDCLFSHQEFKGCNLGARVSVDGDQWREEYPPVINGHLHTPQKIDNVFCPGSSMQSHYREIAVKGIWMVSFGEEAKLRINEEIGYEIVDIGMVRKESKVISISKVSEIQKYVKPNQKLFIELKGDLEEFLDFQKSLPYKNYTQAGVEFVFNQDIKSLEIRIKESKFETFQETFNSIMSTKSERVQGILKQISA